jgi:hypothetical protein
MFTREMPWTRAVDSSDGREQSNRAMCTREIARLAMVALLRAGAALLVMPLRAEGSAASDADAGGLRHFHYRRAAMDWLYSLGAGRCC